MDNLYNLRLEKGITNIRAEMLQSPNYIHFRNEWQFLGLDTAQWPDRKSFQNLMNKLNEPPVDADFGDFSYRTNRCEMGNVRGDSTETEGGQAFTKLVCAPNRITLVEEWTQSTADQFKDESVEVLKAWFELFPHTAIIVQRCCIRALVQPALVGDSRRFIGDRIMGVGESMNRTFKDMPFKVGFTFSCLRHSDGSQLVIDTTVNTWKDNKRVWVQVEGTQPMPKPMNAANPEAARGPFEDSQRFLEAEVINFLKQYDVKKDEGNSRVEE